MLSTEGEIVHKTVELSGQRIYAMGILSEAKHILQDNIWPAFLIPIALFAIRCISIALKAGLRSLPGPTIARFSPFYRVWKISKADAPIFYRNLHEKYGPIIRTGPNTVDISDPDALPIIYGIGSKFLKVWTKNIDKQQKLTGISPHSMMSLALSSRTK